MQYRDDADLSGAQVSHADGAGTASRVAVGGGGMIIVVLLALLFGINPGSVLGSAGSAQEHRSTNPISSCSRGSDIAANRECRWNAYLVAISRYWQRYTSTPASMVIFSGRVNTGCGTATSEVGPFYCPADSKIYLDTAFTAQLLRQLGSRGGDAAEAYVIAHEYGHHIQNQTGRLAQVQSAGQQTGPSSPQVRLELQADCYAATWFRNATADPNGPISAVTQDDLNRIIEAAGAVGDDRVQQSQGGQIRPDSWTHGSAAQRQRWAKVGYDSGDPNRCDTFSPATV